MLLTIIYMYILLEIPVVELSLPSSIRSSHTLLQGVCASNAVFVVTVTTLFPAYGFNDKKP